MEESKQMKELQDRATCYHEAAHAVFALKVIGGTVRYVDADEMYCASRGPVLHGWADHWREAMYTLAGQFAEQLMLWDETRPLPWEEVLGADEVGDLEPGSDDAAIVEHVYGMGGAPEEEYQTVVEDTEEEVRELWPQITAVAEALRERRRLDGKEVAAIIEGEAALSK